MNRAPFPAQRPSFSSSSQGTYIGTSEKDAPLDENTSSSMEGKTVVVTGGSYGVGRAVAIGFSRLGANVVILARDQEKLEETRSLMNKRTSILLLSADLCDPKQVKAATDQIKSHFSQVDVLVNNAAGWYTGTLESMDEESIQNMVNSTVTGSILVTKYLLPALKKSKGHIINVISTAALPAKEIDPSVASVAFYAAKWGQAGFSESVRGELKHFGIRVTSLYPSTIATDSSLDDSTQILTTKHPGSLGVKDLFDAIYFCVTRPPSSTIEAMILKSPSPPHPKN